MEIGKNKKQLNKIIKIFKNKDFVIKPAKSEEEEILLFLKKIKKMFSKNNGREKIFPHDKKKLIF